MSRVVMFARYSGRDMAHRRFQTPSRPAHL